MSALSPARGLRVWGRNFLLWRKLMVPSLIHHMVDPLMYLFALGLGLGALVGDVDGQGYLGFIAPAIVCINVLSVCSFEGLYSAFTRMHMQGTWDAMRNAPMTVDDIVLGEWAWATSKGMLSSGCMLLVLCVVGVVSPAAAAASLPLLLLLGMACSAIALAYNAVSPGYDFFMYFFTLYVTPMLMLSGSFFPIEVLPGWLEAAMRALPLAPTVEAVREAFRGEASWSAAAAAAQLALCAAAALWAAVRLTRRRLA